MHKPGRITAQPLFLEVMDIDGIKGDDTHFHSWVGFFFCTVGGTSDEIRNGYWRRPPYLILDALSCIFSTLSLLFFSFFLSIFLSFFRSFNLSLFLSSNPVALMWKDRCAISNEAAGGHFVPAILPALPWILRRRNALICHRTANVKKMWVIEHAALISQSGQILEASESRLTRFRQDRMAATSMWWVWEN